MISFRRQTSEVNMLSPPDTQWMTTNKMTYTAPITQNQRYKSFIKKGVRGQLTIIEINCLLF